MEKCGKVFGDNTSLFNRRFKCLNFAIRKGKDIHRYAAIVTRMCNAFSYGSLKEDQFRASLPTRIWSKVTKLEHFRLRSPKSTERPKITVHGIRILRANTRIQREINRSVDSVAIFTSIEAVFSISICVRTAIRTDTRKDSVRAVNADRMHRIKYHHSFT
ncbi:unnamed protein product [Hymenolepis diminuta]|uniref:Uncharacterized protein n=1 Tax=Hymenolepis diminuta TaxID=6216 RepID=A0A564YH70_HYMDI|nr:unnamed protein product [Hymenolepis diminuta]